MTRWPTGMWCATVLDQTHTHTHTHTHGSGQALEFVVAYYTDFSTVNALERSICRTIFFQFLVFEL